MSNFLKRIKRKTKLYTVENMAILPVNKEFIEMKKSLVIDSFFKLPVTYQKRVRRFIRGKNTKKLYLVGSLASGGGIIPNVTPKRFIELRRKYSLKVRKDKSDIDLYLIDNSDKIILDKNKHEIVNIESLPQRFEPSFLIYANGKFL